MSAKLVGIARGPARIDPHVATLDPSELVKSLAECGYEALILRIGFGGRHQDADLAHTFALLRPRPERPRRRRAAEQRDERAPVDHSMTSPASESRLSEILTPC